MACSTHQQGHQKNHENLKIDYSPDNSYKQDAVEWQAPGGSIAIFIIPYVRQDMWML